jgi:hypothetical protein
MKTIAILLSLLSLQANALRAAQGQASSGYSTINTDAVKKSIVFILYPRSDSDRTEVGTGFLLQVPITNDPGHHHSVIVTARHIVDPEWAGCHWRNPSAIIVRANSKDYQPGVSATGIWQYSFPLSANGRKLWLSHSDDRVDIAIIPIANEQEAELLRQDDTQLELQDFGTPEEIQKFSIGIGANFISAGLVPAILNDKRNYPAFKFGKISNVLDEPVKMQCEGGETKDRLNWLIAGNFVPGNSGSPLFLQPLEFSLAPPFEFTGPRNMIIGVLSGSIDGADLGEMVPIEYVFEIIKKSYPDADLYRGTEKEKPKGTVPPTPGAR